MKTTIRLRPYILILLLCGAWMGRSSAQHPLLGATDLLLPIDEIPGLPNQLAAAADRAYGSDLINVDPGTLDRFYQPYVQKAADRIKDYQDYTRQKMEAANGAGQDAYLEQSIRNANANPIIANMGGYEAISNMSEEERKAAALQAAGRYAANPTNGQSGQSAGMTALYQRVVSDPVYAQKFQNMSDAEKEAELRKYMANDQAPARPQAQIDEAQNLADRIRNTQAVQLKIAALQQQLSQVMQEFSLAVTRIEQRGRNHDALSEEMDIRYNAIPMVVLGEYGRDHDPEQVQALRLEMAVLHCDRAKEELTAFGNAWNNLRAGYREVAAEYQDFITENQAMIYGGVSPEDMLNGVNTEFPLLQFEASMIGLVTDLCQQAKELIIKTAIWEKAYQELK